MTIHVTWTDDDGVEHTTELPSVLVVCSDCNGKGRTLVAGIREHAYTALEINEDPDFREEYLKGGSGMYGAVCQTCNGQNVENVVDESCQLTANQQKALDYVNEMARYNKEDAQIRRMESGGY